MKKNILVVTFEREAMDQYSRQLSSMFGEEFEIYGYSVLEDIPCGLSEIDLIVVSCHDVTPYINKYITDHIPVIYIMRTFEKSRTTVLDHLSPDSKVLVADYSEIFAYETIGTLNSIGYETYNFIPYKSGQPLEPGICMCLMIGNTRISLPEEIPVFHLGWYLISYTTMMEIARRLSLDDENLIQRINRYSQKVHLVDHVVFEAVQALAEMEGRWNSALDLISEGLLLINKNDIIIQCNEFAARAAGAYKPGQLIGKDLKDVLPAELMDCIRQNGSCSNEIVRLEKTGMLAAVSKKEILLHGSTTETMITLEDITDIQRKEKNIRVKQSKKGLTARYSFDDIVTGSPVMNKCIIAAKKVAGTELSVLITGESGVGKELFAQSIHNYSARRDFPFVAINCAALPAELLESELFGYEEGAFTGAKKGGKKGLFELAHKGTIFLDEIGDMPLQIQAKLLRVLQEREIMRVGGEEMLPVDTRVIAAANEDLDRLLSEGAFRKDLYYRLGAFQISLPPLRQRREDIIPLAETFLRKWENKRLSPDLQFFLTSLPWEGNVRELINCVDYMGLMGEDILTPDDVPPYLLRRAEQSEKQTSCLEEFLTEEQDLITKILRVLDYRNMGRRTLLRVLQDNGVNLTEYKLRKLLDLMEKRGLIQVHQNKKGISKIRDEF